MRMSKQTTIELEKNDKIIVFSGDAQIEVTVASDGSMLMVTCDGTGDPRRDIALNGRTKYADSVGGIDEMSLATFEILIPATI